MHATLFCYSAIYLCDEALVLLLARGLCSMQQLWQVACPPNAHSSDQTLP